MVAPPSGDTPPAYPFDHFSLGNAASMARRFVRLVRQAGVVEGTPPVFHALKRHHLILALEDLNAHVTLLFRDYGPRQPMPHHLRADLDTYAATLLATLAPVMASWGCGPSLLALLDPPEERDALFPAEEPLAAELPKIAARTAEAIEQIAAEFERLGRECGGQRPLPTEVRGAPPRAPAGLRFAEQVKRIMASKAAEREARDRQKAAVPPAATTEVAAKQIADDERDLKINMAIALLVDATRTGCKLNVTQIAKKIGVPRTTLTGWSRFRDAYAAAKGKASRSRQQLKGGRSGSNDFYRDEE